MDQDKPLPRRLDATPQDLDRARETAHAIAAKITGCDPGTMVTAASMSHYVYIGRDVVVKLVDAGGHTRLDREIALAPHLPTGLGAPLIADGREPLGTCAVRYACFTRVAGTCPGIGLPDVDAATAGRWAEQAVQRLHELHTWKPVDEPADTLRGSPVHEGFVSRDALTAELDRLAATNLSRHLLTGLRAIAADAPPHARYDVPVHADCDWDNWLADDETVTLLDFERARYGEPADDWTLLAVTSGPHLHLALDAIANTTATDRAELRAACELRDAAFIAEDLRKALDQPETPAWLPERIHDLEGLIDGRRWWRRPR
ncbi:hypothetical protein [Asanoa sp. NPDC050611]|uniref:phosphotransferase family protein n=1 Tax=Asanoa sp. NPDC050611 TaxID=3157098 RepID=UPI00340B2B70